MSIDKQTLRAFVGGLTNRNVLFEDDDSLIDIGILDSLALVQLLAFIEKHYRVTVDNDELIQENFETVNAIAGFLSKKGI
jgi:acyl carrier protein